MTFSEIMKRCGDRVWGSINGHGRGDGYDVEVFELGQRYLVSVYDVQCGGVSWYVAGTFDDALAVGRAGYTPGTAPGRYRHVVRPGRLAELREGRA